MLGIMEDASRAIPEDYPTFEAAVYFASAPGHQRDHAEYLCQDTQGIRVSTGRLGVARGVSHPSRQGSLSSACLWELGLFHSTYGSRMSNLSQSVPNQTPPTPASLEWIPEAIQEATRVIDVISKRPEATLSDPSSRHSHFDYVLSRFVQFRDSLQAALDRTKNSAKMSGERTVKLVEPTLGRMQFEPLPVDLSMLEEAFDLVAGNQDFDWLIGTDHIARLERDLKVNMVCDVPQQENASPLGRGESLYDPQRRSDSCLASAE